MAARAYDSPPFSLKAFACLAHFWALSIPLARPILARLIEQAWVGRHE